jgi:hypothetical protein
MALALSPSSIGGTLAELIAAGERIFSALKNVCVWNKTNGGMGTFYRSKHETPSRSERHRTPTPLVSATAAAIAPTSGTTPASTP